jgi:hypothetical protein
MKSLRVWYAMMLKEETKRGVLPAERKLLAKLK